MEGSNEDLKLSLLDDLESGEWPSFVKDLKSLGKRIPKVKQLLGQLEDSYETRWNYWQGTVLNVDGYGGGVIGRLSELANKYPDIAQFHTIRIIPPAGFVYSTKKLRELCDISERYSAGILQLHGMTGDILMLGSNTEETFAAAEELMEKGWDIGGSGAALRTLQCCIGEARCEMACFDTQGLTRHLTNAFISYLHRPEFAYKYKFKLSGCPNDCGCSMQRSDMPIVGTWRGPMEIDQVEFKKYLDRLGRDFIVENVIARCPTRCMSLKNDEIMVDPDDCNHCMHCINAMPKALHVGKGKGVTILLGGKRTLKIGDTMSSVLVPFMKMETEDDYNNLVELVERIWEFWNDNGLEHERVGEFIARIGLGKFLEGVGLPPDPRMVKAPRTSNYIKFEELAPSRFDGEREHNPQITDKEIDGAESPLNI